MHYSQVLFQLCSLLLAVDAFAIDKRGCISSDVALVKSQVTHPDYLCTWYLSDCIIDAAPSGTSARIKNEIAEAARSYTFTYGTCPTAAYQFINDEYKDSAAFCNFWGYCELQQQEDFFRAPKHSEDFYVIERRKIFFRKPTYKDRAFIIKQVEHNSLDQTKQ
ncbi:hypothetical protein E4T48_07420 [Aureobasidium sp. EXF-10727]|nr:hypothetical protein E4T48_07420 [Aureobasidium sp. EXF-10727]KAI4730362.1 hypothetical protein E4T49_01698 [Aureobasidium sp. EXF-10728]